MKLRIAVVVLVAALVAGARADQVVQNVQQALKDQGFYYGEVTGEKDADTTAAVRRYQIRNGLQISGDLNDETLKSLGVDSSGARAIVKASPTPAPAFNWPAVSGTAARSIRRRTDSRWRTSTGPTGLRHSSGASGGGFCRHTV